MHPQQSCSVKDEWYTPSYIVNSCARVLVGNAIKVDLASSQKAKDYHISQSDALAEASYFCEEFSFLDKYKARSDFWCNPPFSKLKDFSIHLETLYLHGCLDRGFILVNQNTETRWFHRLLNISNVICFLDHRIKFINSETLEPSKNNPKGQVILGVNVTESRYYLSPLDNLGQTFILK
jgi:hypothetical protein